MKRNRFQEMIPSTPADFHGAVADALNRVEAAERRHRMSVVRVSAFAAAAAAMVLVVCLAAMMPKRLPREDIVTAPNPTQMIVRATEEPQDTESVPNEFMVTAVRATEQPELVSMEIGAWKVSEDGGLELEWSMTATDEETLLVCGDARPVFANGAQLDGFELFNLDDSSVSPDYLQIGEDILGVGNGTVIRKTGKSGWRGKTPMALAIHFDVYRPTAALIEDALLGEDSFENKPAWWVSGVEKTPGYIRVIPIDWYDASREYNTYFGSKLVSDTLYDLRDDFGHRKTDTSEDALEYLQEVGALRTALLEGYDFADHVRSFDYIIDLSAGSGVGASEILE